MVTESGKKEDGLAVFVRDVEVEQQPSMVAVGSEN
jgi:hypothetical protein